MFRNIKKILSFLTVFLIVFNQIELPLKVNAENNLGVEVTLEIDESIGSLDINFDNIDRFNEYGIAIIVKNSYDNQNQLVKLYGLINKTGEVVLEPIYTSIVDYNENYYSILKQDSNNYLEGVASKKTGELIIPVEYNYIPFMDINGIYNLNKEVSPQVWRTELVSYVDGVIQYAQLPQELDSNLYNNLWSRRLFEDVYQINGYREYSVGEITKYENINWLSNEKGEVLFDQIYSYISDFHKLNGAYYFTTNNYKENQSSSKGGLYKLTLINGISKIETLLDPNDYNGIWLDTSKNEVEVYRVENNNWISSRYHLENGWIGGLGFGEYQESIFPYYSNPKFNMRMKCTGLDSKVCYHYLTLASDSTNRNLFDGKEYTYILNSMFDDYYVLHNSEENKTNIFIQRNNEYFMAFTEDVSGWTWVDQNHFIEIAGKKIDLLTLTDTKPFEEIESYQSTGNQYIYSIDNRFLVYNDLINNMSFIKDRANNQFILNSVYSILSIDFKDNFLSVVYNINSGSIFENRVLVYDAANKSIIINEAGIEVSNSENKEYFIIKSSLGTHSLYFKDGMKLVDDVDENYKIRFYNNDSVALGSGNGLFNVYLLNTNKVSSYLDLNEAVISEGTPIYISSDTGQKYLLNGVELDTTGLIKISAFVDGHAYVKDENENIYSVDASNIFDKSNLINDAIDFNGSILKSIDNKYIYRVTSSQNSFDLDLGLNTNFKQLSEYIYSYINESSSLQIIAYDSISNQFNRFFDVSEIHDISINQNFVIYEIKHIQNDKNYTTLINQRGHIIDQVENGSFIYKNNYYLKNLNGIFSIHNYDGNNLANGTNLETFTNIQDLKDNYVYVTNNESKQELIFIGDDGIKQFGNVNFESTMISNRFYRISRINETQSNSVGLVDVDGNQIIDIGDNNVGFNINEKYQLIQPYKIQLNQMIYDGIHDYNGILIEELIGYENDSNLNISNEGILKLRKPTGYYQQCYNNDNQVFLCNSYVYNEYNSNTGEVIYEKDYVNQSLIDNGNLKRISTLTFTLESMIPENLINYYTGDIYFDSDGNRVRATFKETFYDLQNNPIFDQTKYDQVRFDGQNFIASNFNENREAINSTLISKNGEILLSGYMNIMDKEELGWYSGSSWSVVPNPNNPEEDYWVNIEQVYTKKTNKTMPYFFNWVNYENLIRDGYVRVGAYQNVTNIEDITIDTELKYGVLLKDGSFLVSPQFDNIGDFTRTGNATTSKLISSFTCYFYNQFGDYIENTCNNYKYGLLNLENGIIIDTEFDAIESTTPNRMNWNTPNFDKDGHVKVVNYKSYNGSSDVYRFVGLASISGTLFEGAEYQYAYYKNAFYYLKKYDQNWFVINASNFDDKKEIIVPNLENDVEISAIEIIDDYIIVTQRIYDPIFDKSYEYYGVLNEDMSLFLDFDYSKIRFEDNKFYLEIYNTSLGTTQQAVMDESKNYLVPFNSKYDSISDYVDGYAIGTSGAKEPDDIGYTPFVKMLNILFTNVSAKDTDFVLEVIDDEGKVVGDLSDEYESATLLGSVNGTTKALVKKNGKFYIANLVERPIERIALTGIELSPNSKTLNIGESFNFNGVLIPSNTNDQIKKEWISSDESIAYIDSYGRVEALKEGVVTITFKVNEFSSSSTLLIKSSTNSTDSTFEIVESIMNNSSNVDKVHKDKVVDSVQFLVDTLNNRIELDDNKLLNALSEIYAFDENFANKLSNDEAKRLDEHLNRIFNGLFKIESNTTNNINFKIDGLLLGLDIIPLLNGNAISVEVKISNKISNEDQKLIEEYISNSKLDNEYAYSLDIEIIQIVDSIRSKLNELNRPVTFTFTLPEEFIGVGKLKILHVHNGEVKELNVILNSNYTFSFTTDEFSSFTLIKDEYKKIINNNDDSSVTVDRQNNWLGFISIFIVLIATVFMLRKRIS